MNAVSCEKIYSSSALATRQREVKDAATKGVVHITENGNGAYIFCSEEIFQARLNAVREEALYEAEMRSAINRAQEDVEHGRYTSDVQSFTKRVLQKRGLCD